MADFHAGLRKRGVEFGERAWQQISWKLERDAYPKESGARRSLVGDCGEHPVEREGTGRADLEEDLRVHPLTAFADHGTPGSGEPLAIMLRPGNAGSDTAADHIEVIRLALAQLPPHLRRRVLFRADSGGGTQEHPAWLAKPGRRLAYSVGFPMTEDVQDAILKIPCGHGPRLRQ